MDKVKVAVIGPGNIGSDLMFKIMKSDYLQMELMTGRRYSDGIKRAESMGFRTSINGIDDIMKDDSIEIVFDATSANAHFEFAPALKEAGKITIDLTPAAVGP